MTNPTVAVIIPTLNAERQIGPLLSTLQAQSVLPNEILVVDSSSDDRTVEIARTYDGVSVHQIDRDQFNHGLTRDQALRSTSADIVCFFTQDAMPADRQVLSELIKPLLEDEGIAISTGRQVPKPEARRFEQLVREYNYPPRSEIRSERDIPRLGIKVFFTSDVCAAYRRTTYLELGGFGEADMCEDMLMSARAIYAGHKVAYCAEARVIHSHDLTLRQQYRRNAAIGALLTERQEELRIPPELGEGRRLAFAVLKQLSGERRLTESVAFLQDCVARLAGNRLGRRSPNILRG